MLTDSSFQLTEKNTGNWVLALSFGPPHSGIGLLAGCLQLFGISLSDGLGGQSINRILVQDLGGVPGQGSLLPKGWLQSESAYQPSTRKAHYKVTPYNFNPKMGLKMTNDPHIDMGQGLLQCIAELYEEVHQDKHAELGVFVNGKD